MMLDLQLMIDAGMAGSYRMIEDFRWKSGIAYETSAGGDVEEYQLYLNGKRLEPGASLTCGDQIIAVVTKPRPVSGTIRLDIEHGDEECHRPDPPGGRPDRADAQNCLIDRELRAMDPRSPWLPENGGTPRSWACIDGPR